MHDSLAERAIPDSRATILNLLKHSIAILRKRKHEGQHSPGRRLHEGGQRRSGRQKLKPWVFRELAKQAEAGSNQASQL
jgi:hypothetical protein